MATTEPRSRAPRQPGLIERSHLRDHARGLLLDYILSGSLPPGEPVGEEALAQEFGISRTPLREALLVLEREGFVDAYHGRGFIVRPLSAKEAREVYPLVWALESLALGDATRSNPAWLAALRASATKLKGARTAHERVTCDMRWHEALISQTGNERLKHQLSLLKIVIRRYEVAYMNDPAPIETSMREHARIVKVLGAHDITEAQSLLVAHWQAGLKRLLLRLGN